jgi:hypothetical protein
MLPIFKVNHEWMAGVARRDESFGSKRSSSQHMCFGLRTQSHVGKYFSRVFPFRSLSFAGNLGTKLCFSLEKSAGEMSG